MPLIGYARVSTTDQDLEIQLAALKAAGCAVIRSEKVTGTSRAGRSELATVLDFIAAGDTSKYLADGDGVRRRIVGLTLV